MNNGTNLESLFINERLTNVEFIQTLVSRQFLTDLSYVIALTQPTYAKKDLFRLGQNADGGYVLAPEFQANLCLNLGVGYEVTADLDLIGLGFKIFAFDGTVPNPLPGEISYVFTQKNIGYSKGDQKVIDLRTVFGENPELEDLDLILMDIEGHEYEVLKKELSFITKAKQIVVEFHGLELLGDQRFAADLIEILKGISKSHSPIHVHGNNAGGALLLGGASWPTVLEVTFLRHEFCTNEVKNGIFPTSLDFPNISVRPDIDLTPFYGEKKTYASLSRTVLGIS